MLLKIANDFVIISLLTISATTLASCNAAPMIGNLTRIVNTEYGYVEYQAPPGFLLPDYTTNKRFFCNCDVTDTWNQQLNDLFMYGRDIFIHIISEREEYVDARIIRTSRKL